MVTVTPQSPWIVSTMTAVFGIGAVIVSSWASANPMGPKAIFEALAMACPSVGSFLSIHNMCAKMLEIIAGKAIHPAASVPGFPGADRNHRDRRGLRETGVDAQSAADAGVGAHHRPQARVEADRQVDLDLHLTRQLELGEAFPIHVPERRALELERELEVESIDSEELQEIIEATSPGPILSPGTADAQPRRTPAKEPDRGQDDDQAAEAEAGG